MTAKWDGKAEQRQESAVQNRTELEKKSRSTSKRHKLINLISSLFVFLNWKPLWGTGFILLFRCFVQQEVNPDVAEEVQWQLEVSQTVKRTNQLQLCLSYHNNQDNFYFLLSCLLLSLWSFILTKQQQKKRLSFIMGLACSCTKLLN